MGKLTHAGDCHLFWTVCDIPSRDTNEQVEWAKLELAGHFTYRGETVRLKPSAAPGIGMSGSIYNTVRIWEFEFEEDAILFKLRWK